MVDSIESVLMERDGMTAAEADSQIAEAKAEIWDMLGRGEDPYNICVDYWGLEPDYIEELIF